MSKPNVQKDKRLILDVLRKLKTRESLSNFVDDLFTEEEILDLAQRLKIAKGIEDGKTYEDIAKEIDTSTSTVTKIGQVIKYGKGSFKKIFSKKPKKK